MLLKNFLFNYKIKEKRHELEIKTYLKKKKPRHELSMRTEQSSEWQVGLRNIRPKAWV